MGWLLDDVDWGDNVPQLSYPEEMAARRAKEAAADAKLASRYSQSRDIARTCDACNIVVMRELAARRGGSWSAEMCGEVNQEEVLLEVALAYSGEGDPLVWAESLIPPAVDPRPLILWISGNPRRVLPVARPLLGCDYHGCPVWGIQDSDGIIYRITGDAPFEPGLVAYKIGITVSVDGVRTESHGNLRRFVNNENRFACAVYYSLARGGGDDKWSWHYMTSIGGDGSPIDKHGEKLVFVQVGHEAVVTGLKGGRFVRYRSDAYPATLEGAQKIIASYRDYPDNQGTGQWDYRMVAPRPKWRR